MWQRRETRCRDLMARSAESASERLRLAPAASAARAEAAQEGQVSRVGIELAQESRDEEMSEACVTNNAESVKPRIDESREDSTEAISRMAAPPRGLRKAATPEGERGESTTAHFGWCCLFPLLLVVLPFFPSFGWCWFSTLFCWVVLHGCVCCFSPFHLGGAAFLLLLWVVLLSPPARFGLVLFFWEAASPKKVRGWQHD